MYLLKKSAKNLLKNKGRNIIIFIMMTIVTLASVVSLTIFNLTKKIQTETENYYSGEVSVAPKNENTEELILTAEEFSKYSDSEYLRSYVFYRGMPINIDNLKLFDDEYNSEPETGNRVMSMNARVYGLLDEYSMEDFSYGERVIVEGHFPADSTECMISSDLAGLNSLTLGDTITFILGPEQSEQGLTVSGIYSDSTVEHRQANHRASQLNTRNDIITNYDFLSYYDHAMDEASSFLLRDSDDIEAFQQELYSKGLSEDYILEYDTERYTAAAAEIQQMASVVTAFMGIIALIGMSIVFLVNLFALRERKYEIGVLRAIGMPKSKVVLLLVGEMQIISMVSVIISLITGIFINPAVVDFMMRLEMNHELPSALKNAVSVINSSISLDVMLQAFILTTLLVLLAGSATISNIMRFDPNKILSERN